MANATIGNKIYIDSTGALNEKRTLVSYILFTSHSSHSELVLREEAGGQIVMLIDGKDANTTYLYDFSNTPVLFVNGIHATITSGCHATLITTSGGG